MPGLLLLGVALGASSHLLLLVGLVPSFHLGNAIKGILVQLRFFVGLNFAMKYIRCCSYMFALTILIHFYEPHIRPWPRLANLAMDLFLSMLLLLLALLLNYHEEFVLAVIHVLPGSCSQFPENHWNCTQSIQIVYIYKGTLVIYLFLCHCLGQLSCSVSMASARTPSLLLGSFAWEQEFNNWGNARDKLLRLYDMTQHVWNEGRCPLQVIFHLLLWAPLFVHPNRLHVLLLHHDLELGNERFLQAWIS